MDDQGNRPHRKTKEKKGHDKSQPNPKAFAFAKPGKLTKNAHRSGDVRIDIDILNYKRSILTVPR